MSAQKDRFQAAMRRTPALVPLFNNQLSDKITALSNLAQKAEDTWWSLARAEFEPSGGQISANPVNSVNSICEGASALAAQILLRLNLVCDDGTTFVPATWIGTWEATNKTLYAPHVKQVCDALLAKVEALKALLSDVHDMETYEARLDSFESVYEWAKGAFELFGPKFPRVVTSFHSKASGMYSYPTVGITFGAEVELTNFTGDASPAEWFSGNYKLVAGNKIYIAKLTPSTVATVDVQEALATLVGQLGLTVKGQTDGVLTIERDGYDLYDWEEMLNPEMLDAAETFGDVFEIRLLEYAEGE